MKTLVLCQLISLFTAYILDAIFGDPLWFYHPVRIMGGYVKWYRSHFYNLKASPRRLRISGLVMVISSVLLVGAITTGLLWGCYRIHPVVYIIINSILMCTCLAPTCMVRETKKIERIVRTGNIEAARKQLSYIVGRDVTQFPMEEVILATVETTAENTSDGTISPLFCMLIGGAPLGMMFKMSSTMDSMVGYDNEKYHDFGRYPAKNDDVWNFIPARLAGFFLVTAAYLLPGVQGNRSYDVMKRDHAQHLSPNCGYPEGASAGALGLRMGGPNVYFGKLVEKPYIGDDLHVPRPYDITRMNRLMRTACNLFWICCLGVLLILYMIL